MKIREDEFDIVLDTRIITVTKKNLKRFLFENKYHLRTADTPNIGDWKILDEKNKYVGSLIIWYR